MLASLKPRSTSPEVLATAREADGMDTKVGMTIYRIKRKNNHQPVLFNSYFFLVSHNYSFIR